jgi:hypothetical protein
VDVFDNVHVPALELLLVDAVVTIDDIFDLHIAGHDSTYTLEKA